MSDRADELRLYIDNDGRIYASHTKPALAALAIEKSTGKFTRKNGLARFARVVAAGALAYKREFDEDNSFSAADKTEVAAGMLDYFEVEYGLGNYNHLLPKNATAPSQRWSIGDRVSNGKTGAERDTGTVRSIFPDGALYVYWDRAVESYKEWPNDLLPLADRTSQKTRGKSKAQLDREIAAALKAKR